MKISLEEINEEVLVSKEEISVINRETIAWLKDKALGNTRERARICAHRSTDDAVHEMLIVHTAGTYVRPHKHPNKSESFHIIEGDLDIVVFDDSGYIKDIIYMGEYPSGRTFYWRLSESYFHTVIPRSNVVVFHESTSGPFHRATSNVPAGWSPEETDQEGIDRYTSWLEEIIDSDRQSKGIPKTSAKSDGQWKISGAH